MPGNTDILHSMLIVSAAESFAALVRNSLPGGKFTVTEYRKSAAAARRCILERFFDIVVINCPLPDELGLDLAMDLAENSQAGILVVVPSEIYEEVLDHVTDQGILAIAKPAPHGRIGTAVRFLMAIQNKRFILEQKAAAAKDKLEELRIVSRAKIVLVEKKHLTEEEAHRYIGRAAMNNGISRRRAAENILDDMED